MRVSPSASRCVRDSLLQEHLMARPSESQRVPDSLHRVRPVPYRDAPRDALRDAVCASGFGTHSRGGREGQKGFPVPSLRFVGARAGSGRL